MGAPAANSLAAGLLDLLLPVRCSGCARPGEALCAHCAAGIVAAPEYALPGLDGAAAVGLHEELLREAVVRLKFAGRLSLAAPLGSLLARLLEERAASWAFDAVVPVPCHWTRQLRR